MAKKKATRKKPIKEKQIIDTPTKVVKAPKVVKPKPATETKRFWTPNHGIITVEVAK